MSYGMDCWTWTRRTQQIRAREFSDEQGNNHESGGNERKNRTSRGISASVRNKFCSSECECECPQQSANLLCILHSFFFPSLFSLSFHPTPSLPLCLCVSGHFVYHQFIAVTISAIQWFVAHVLGRVSGQSVRTDNNAQTTQGTGLADRQWGRLTKIKTSQISWPVGIYRILVVFWKKEWM